MCGNAKIISDARVKYADFAKKTEPRIAVGAMRGSEKNGMVSEVLLISCIYVRYPEDSLADNSKFD